MRIWRIFKIICKNEESIHLKKFVNIPKKWNNQKLGEKWTILKKIRDYCNISIEEKRAEKKLKKSSNFYGVDTLIKDTKNENPINLMSDFLYEIEQNIEKLANGKKTQIIKEWTKKSETIGKKVTVNTLGGKISGMAKKIDGDGALILKTNDGIRRIFVGDIITT